MKRIVYVISTFSLLLGTLTAKQLSGPEIWQQFVVPKIHARFLEEVPSSIKFEQLVNAEGGSIILDHGATRTPDPQTHAFITRIAEAFGLQVNDHYEFPEKKLTAIDLQLKEVNSFKWFSTLINYKELSPEAILAIEEDIDRTENKLSDKGLKILNKLEKKRYLTQKDAERLSHELVYKFMSRQGLPLKESTIALLSNESPETLNALLLGPDFNHIAYSLNHLNIKHWYGLEIIEVLTSIMKQEGFKMLPTIQGNRGGVLRQTSTLADPQEFITSVNDNSNTTSTHPAKFIEFIQRGIKQNEQGSMLVHSKSVDLFQGFIRDNADKIYESTGSKI